MKECRDIKEGLEGSRYIGELPLGCKLCYQGAKAVIFLTGICYEKCYYCPISSVRRNKDVMYVNEEKAETFNEVLREIYEMKALGASITGGEPLIYPQRVIRIIKFLKNVLGENFHIHLYTIGKHLARELLAKLYNEGLDEIRFHVRDWRVLKNVELAIKHTGLDVGIEVPVIPGLKKYYFKLIREAEKLGVKFINLNEMEFTESNEVELRRRGFKLKKDSYVAVEGSEELAIEILKWSSCNTEKITIHYCSVAYKDKVQTRRRLLRKAQEIAKPYEEITREGLLRHIVLKVPKNLWRKDVESKMLLTKLPLDIVYGEEDVQVLLHPHALRHITGGLYSSGIRYFKAYIVEKYPTRNNVVKNIIPLVF